MLLGRSVFLSTHCLELIVLPAGDHLELFDLLGQLVVLILCEPQLVLRLLCGLLDLLLLEGFFLDSDIVFLLHHDLLRLVL